ncbi:MAG: YjhG/YagF family D-xylonate dehydratase [Planctomycetota bacterium]|jgi:putative YjhG/YagF family dehydratase|nr:YjhG/YagF family D-xylonate dehydratase [Planctomycetota bacterium]
MSESPSSSTKRGTLDIAIDSVPNHVYDIITHAEGPKGSLPLTEEMLLEKGSGDVFALSMNAGMGWNPEDLSKKEILILSTQGGIRAPDGSPTALGYHTGHWEVGLLMQAAAEEIRQHDFLPFAAFCTDPCDGRSQGTRAMLDSLPYRNDAAIVFRRLIRSLPNRNGVMGVATCDKGLPAMLLALSAMHDLPCILVPGGVTLPATEGEDSGTVQTIGARFAHQEITLERAAELGCRACATPGGGCQFLGTAATSQVISEALGLALPHTALGPSGQPIWLDAARRSARALIQMEQQKIKTRDILTPQSIENAMVVHAAFGGSTNLILHLPAIAFSAGLERPTVDDWAQINRKVPRLVSVLPNGPTNHPTIRVFLSGGVPEVMLHLRRAGLLHEDCMTVSGRTLGENLDEWESSERRKIVRELLTTRDGIDPNEVIMDPGQARKKGITSTVTFPRGNLAPQGSVIKSTAIDPSVVDEDGVYRKTGPARIYTRERDAVRAIKSNGPERVKPGDIIVLICCGPMGSGMEEVYQVTSALKHISWGKEVAVVTDARFSGVSTGACIGHVGPEALAGGPIGKVLEGDILEIVVDRNKLEGTVNLIGHGKELFGAERGQDVLQERSPRSDLAPHPHLPEDTRLWAALQNISGGTWGGCVYDVNSIAPRLSPDT